MNEELNNILKSVKLALGGSLVSYSDNAFDSSLLMHINSVFVILNQLGIGPREIFVADENSEWDEFLVENSAKLRIVQSYMYLRIRLIFDPPSSSFVLDAIKEQIKEYEFRMNVHVDPGSETE